MAPKELQSSSKSSGDAEQHTRSIWNNGICTVMERCTVNMKIHETLQVRQSKWSKWLMSKTVNVQEGQQYIITPHHHSTNSFTTWTGQVVASQCTIPQGPDVHSLHR